MSATAPGRGAAETVPIEHETFDRVVRTLVFGIPPAALAVAGWLAWGGTLHWHDLLVLAITYTLTGLGITVGYHRLFTHRSFKTSRTVRALLAVLRLDGGRGTGHRMGLDPSQAPPLLRPRGRPAQPACRPARRGGAGRCAAWPTPTSAGCSAARTWPTRRRYAKDLLADRDLRFISRTFPLWVAVGLAIPFGLGFALSGSLAGGLTGLLWGGPCGSCSCIT